MQTLRIGQLNAHYRMPRQAVAQRGRLDRIVRSMLDDMLEPALDRAGVSPYLEICIRELRLPLRLRLADSDHEMSLASSIALAAAIKQTIDGGDSNCVVRYGSRVHALIDFTVGVAHGDLRRGWAWRQLGFTVEPASPAGVLRAWRKVMLSHPAAIVPVLRTTVRENAWKKLARQLDADTWSALAKAAVKAFGGNPELAGNLDGAAMRRQVELEPIGIVESDRVTAMLRAGLYGSPLARAIAADAAPPLRAPESCLALAALACLDVDPGVLRGGIADVASRMQRTIEILLAMSDRPRDELPKNRNVVSPEKSEPTTESTNATGGEPTDPHSGSATALGGKNRSSAQPSDRANRSRARPRNLDPSCAETPLRLNHRDPIKSLLGDGPTSGETPSDRIQRGPASVPRDNDATSESAPLRPVPSVRTRATTDHGGLLFLIHVLQDLDFPEQLLSKSPLADRLLRWVVHQLGMLLASASEDDPAVLAFAGLGPAAQPPAFGVPRPTSDERQEMSMWLERIGESLHCRLGQSDRRGSALISWVCGRRAEVVADPGWIEVHFSLDDADPAIRRAGLDLDPGFVPWLGVVLKFAYE